MPVRPSIQLTFATPPGAALRCVLMPPCIYLLAGQNPSRHPDSLPDTATVRSEDRERPGTALSTGPVLTDTGTSPAQSRPAASRAPTGAHARHPSTEPITRAANETFIGEGSRPVLCGNNNLLSAGEEKKKSRTTGVHPSPSGKNSVRLSAGEFLVCQAQWTYTRRWAKKKEARGDGRMMPAAEPHLHTHVQNPTR